MSQRSAQPRPGARTIEADICDRCMCMFFDKTELADVAQVLGGLPSERASFDAAQPPSPRLSSCPKCGATGRAGPHELDVVGVTIDFCRSCSGVYLERGEYEALMAATAPPPERGPTYRSPPNGAVAQGKKFSCLRCGVEKPLSDSVIVPKGLVCGSCFYATGQDALGAYQNEELRSQIMRGRFQGPDLNPMQNGSCSRCGAQRMHCSCTEGPA